MKSKVLLVIILTISTLISKIVIADEYFPFVEFTCIPEANYLKVRAEGFYNIGAYKKESDIVKAIEKKSSLNYVGWNNPMSKSCAVGGRKVQIDLNYRQPQAKGECGGEERATLKVSIDGLAVLDGASFHSGCFTYSVNELDFSSLQYGHFKVCGRYTERKPFKNKNVCAGVHLKKVENAAPVNIEDLLKEYAVDY